MISSDPDPHIILLRSQLNFVAIFFLNFLDFPSGYFEKFKFISDKILLTFGLTPSADSLAESLIGFLIFSIFETYIHASYLRCYPIVNNFMV